MESSKKNEVLVQAGILAAASIVVRIIGLLYRSPLTAIIGDEGNGYYGTAYNIYTIILLISSYSVPSAISKIMAQKMAMGQYRGAQRVFHAALVYNIIVGTVCGLFLYFGAGLLVPKSCVPVLRVFAPTIFLFGILGALRGYYQARGSMVQTSVSQIFEQIMNAVISIAAAAFLMHLAAGESSSVQAGYGAIGSALGTGSGVVTALLIMAFCYFRDRGDFLKAVRLDKTHDTEPFPHIMKETVLVITPFILSSFILNLTTSLNQTIFMKIMIDAKDLEEVAITTIYGIFSNKAVVITNIPISIATAVSAAIIPSISASFARGNREDTAQRAENAKWMTMLIATPCAGGLIFLGRPIMMLLFPQKQSLQTASMLLMLLAVTVIFYSVSTITNAVLQSIGKMALPLVSAGIALVIQTLLLVALLNFTDMGIYTLVLASVIYSVMIFVMNEFFLKKYLDIKTDIMRMFVKPVLSSIVMGICARGIYEVIYNGLGLAGVSREYFRNLFAAAPAILAAVIVYFAVMLKIKGIRKEDIRLLPKSNVLLKILYRE